MQNTIVEACHYYQSVGFTKNAYLGLHVSEKIMQNGHKLMLFIDDIHEFDEAPHEEKISPIVNNIPDFDYIVFESEMVTHAQKGLGILNDLSRKKRPKVHNGRYFCSGTALTHTNNAPTCVLLDLGLSMYKQQLGFAKAINVLPLHYKEQQEFLHRLVKKSMRNFELETVLYDRLGNVLETIQVEV